MKVIKRVGIVAHDNRKKDMVEWVLWNRDLLLDHKLVCTGTTGSLVEHALKNANDGSVIELSNPITSLKSGPLGGDQQLGAMIAEGKIDMVIFFWDPMEAQPHDVDVKALLRISTLYNIPTATNRATADFMISSPLFNGEYERVVKDYADYIKRNLSL